MQAVLEAALVNTLAAAVIAVVVFGITRVWKNPHLGHILWMLVLAKLVTPPVLRVDWPTMVASNTSNSRAATVATASKPIAGNPTTLPSDAPESPGSDAGKSQIPATDREGRTTIISVLPALRWQHIQPLLATAWLTGSILYLGVLIPRIVRFNRMLQGTLPASDELQRRTAALAKSIGLGWCPQVRLVQAPLAPFVWSVGVRPIIVLPIEIVHRLSHEEVDTVILHELVHVRRRDYLVRWLEMAATALYWWNPLMWFVRSQLREAEEQCCDAWVATVLSEKTRLYARCMLRVAEMVSAPRCAVPLAATGLSHVRSLKRRIEMIVRCPVHRRLSLSTKLAVLVFGVLVLPVAILPKKSTSERQPGIAIAEEAKTHEAATGNFQIPQDKVRAICTMDRDGSNFEVLVKEPSPSMVWNGSPRWSYDGKMVAFDSTTANADWCSARIYVIAVSGPFKGKVADLGFGVIPSWSPDDRQITFQLNHGNPDNARPGVWIVNSDGTGRKWLADACMPHWSPRGDLIACTDQFGTQRRVLLLDPITGRLTQLSDDEPVLSKSRLTWAPDGDRLAFVPSSSLDNELFWIINVRDSKKTPISLGTLPKGEGDPENCGYPAWSPDGKQMVFQTFTRPGEGQILYSMSAEVPSAPIRLGKPKIGSQLAFASWAPDSKRIVFSCLLRRDAKAVESQQSNSTDPEAVTIASTPEEAFRRLVTSSEQGDIPAVCTCLTKSAVDDIIASILVPSRILLRHDLEQFIDVRVSDESAKRELMTTLRQQAGAMKPVLEKHEIDVTAIPQELDNEALRRLAPTIANLVRDREVFLDDTYKALRRFTGGRTVSDVLDLPAGGAQLVELRVDNISGAAQAVGLSENGKWSVTLKKIDGTWKLDKPTRILGDERRENE